MAVKIEDALFWILIAMIVGLAIWKLFGSPTDTAALVSITLFVATSEGLIWRILAKNDKKTCVGFERIKGEFKMVKKDIDNCVTYVTYFSQFSICITANIYNLSHAVIHINNLEFNLNKRLDNIETLIRTRNKK